jgi:hypothetical protein
VGVPGVFWRAGLAARAGDELAVTILVLGSFVKFFLYLNRTARQAREIEAEGSDAVFQSR